MEAIEDDLCAYEWATDAHLPAIVAFLHENFDKEETMLKSLRNNNAPTAEEEESMRIDHERLIRAIFAFSPCVIAVHKSSGTIVGVNLMIISRNPKLHGDADGVSAAFTNNPPTSRLMKRYFDYLSEISDSVDLYGKFPEARAAVEFYAVAVARDYRGIGIATKLMNAGISFAKTVPDAGFIFGVYTSLYSKRAAAKLGLKTLMDIDLLSYRDDEGSPIFQDTPPHNIVSIMALPIA